MPVAAALLDGRVPTLHAGASLLREVFQPHLYQRLVRAGWSHRVGAALYSGLAPGGAFIEHEKRVLHALGAPISHTLLGAV